MVFEFNRPYSERMAGQPRRVRILVALVIIVLPLAWAGTFVPRALAAERTTITVESCDLSGPKATQRCRGSWQLADGRTVRGAVGPASGMRVGDRASGWGTDSEATTNLVHWLLAPVVIGLVVGGALLAFLVVWIRATVAARRTNRSGTTATGPPSQPAR